MLTLLTLWEVFFTVLSTATLLKMLLVEFPYSTDFEVHRNWLALTHSLPLKEWYFEETSEWTLDYPPFFAYFEWALSKIAKYIDPEMLIVQNLNYVSFGTIIFQRFTVIVTDVILGAGVWRCLKAFFNLKWCKMNHNILHFTAVWQMANIGLIFVDNIHFQYNGLLFGILLLSISFLLEDRYLWSAFTFAVLLNFKHIFLYVAPAYAIYCLKFYCLGSGKNPLVCVLKLAVVGLTPFALAFGPFVDHLPQVFSRLFPFKRGLTHAYWAPNFWAIYNTFDKVGTYLLRIPQKSAGSSTAGLVQEIKHILLPTITPTATFFLSLIFMMPILFVLFCYTSKSASKITFLRSIVLCSCASFMFGWHVHEKAILMTLIPLSLLSLIDASDAKYAFFLSIVGYFSLLPLLHQMDNVLIGYSLYLAYIAGMYALLSHIHKNSMPKYNLLEIIYMNGFVFLPIYEHIVSPAMGLDVKLPFMPLLLTSFYCSLGVLYFFIRYYFYTIKQIFYLPKTMTATKKVKLN